MGTIDMTINEHVATIQFNRPEKLNTITQGMARQLAEHVSEVNNNHDIRVVVLTGIGEKSFSAGSDINLIDEYGTNWEFRNRFEYCDVLRNCRKPVIAMIKGYALGGGLELALCSDLRFAGKSAKLGAVEVKLGWIGGGGITQLLTHLIGYGKAMKLILSGDIISAEEANDLGLFEAYLPDEELEKYTYDFAKKVAKYSPIALQTAKHGCRMALNIPLDQGIAYERDLQTICFFTEDKDEGINAFKEKREAQFKGQ